MNYRIKNISCKKFFQKNQFFFFKYFFVNCPFKTGNFPPDMPDSVDVGIQVTHVLAPIREDGVIVVDLQLLTISSQARPFSNVSKPGFFAPQKMASLRKRYYLLFFGMRTFLTYEMFSGKTVHVFTDTKNSFQSTRRLKRDLTNTKNY